jgi:hypothetical protein
MEELGTGRYVAKGCHELDKLSNLPSEHCAEESVTSLSTVLPETTGCTLLVPHARPWLVLDNYPDSIGLLKAPSPL